MEKVKKMAQNISNQEEINEKSKINQIEKLYKKELKQFKEKKKYVVARKKPDFTKSKNKGGRNVKFVDKRMKKREKSNEIQEI